jgi:type II secretory pathway pseudopilin PulG
MSPANLLEQAQKGDLKAISFMINRSLEKQNIKATVDLNDGCLDVMLDASKIPNEAAADFIYKGLSKLNVDVLYQATIYGREAGEYFATWSRTFSFKPRPLKDTVYQLRHEPQFAASARQRSSNLTLTVATGDGDTKTLDLAQAMGFLGVALLLFGVFSPMVSLPIVGSLTYFRNGHIEAIALLGMSIASIICLSRNLYEWLYGPGLGALVLVGTTFYYYQNTLSNLKSNLERELSGNPFLGLADATMASIQLQWGWAFLFLGTVLIVSAAQLKQRHLTRQTFISIGITLAGVIILASTQSVSSSFQYQESANKAKQSEAKTNTGSINRAQQAYFLEKNQFSQKIDDLGLGIKSETTNYNYQITVAEKDMTVATATAKVDGLKSYTGAVSLVQIVAIGENTTIAILCESDAATKTAPSSPILVNNSLQCPSGSSDPSANSK